MLELAGQMLPSEAALVTFWTDFLGDVLDGIYLAIGTFVLTLILEIWSLETVRKVLKQPAAGPNLYKAAILSNIRNHFCFGWPIYASAAALFCREKQELDAVDRVGCVSLILLVHSILFYSAHYLFHSSPELYQHHRFHHRFNTYVPPMAANAVSPTEYIVAYILPFTVPMPFCRPDPISLRISVAIVAITNVLVHTPKLDELSQIYLPEWLVSTHDHLEHHRKLNTKYAAPTINIDYFVENVPKLLGFCERNSSPLTADAGRKDG
jgi:sterol desaturase/sphingolipid hydroxylase (fatty acid hydroxylase superfamily)